MNINDLNSSDYKVVSSPTQPAAAPATGASLNINTLPQGSYTTIPDINTSPAPGPTTSSEPTPGSWAFKGQQLLGAAKGALSTLSNAAKFPQAVLDQTVGRVTNAMQGKGFTAPSTPPLSSVLPTNATVPTNTAQKWGFYPEQVAEFFVPVGSEEKGLALLDEAAPEVADLASKGNAWAKLAQLATKTFSTAAEFGAKTLAQTGDIKQAGESAVMGGLVTPATEGASKILGGLADYLPTKLMTQIFNTDKEELMKAYSQVANGKTMDPKLAEKALQEGLYGSSQSMAVRAMQTLEDTEAQLQEVVKGAKNTVDLPNHKAYGELLDTIENQFKKGFFSSRATEAGQLGDAIKSTAGKIDQDTALQLKRFLDDMRSTSAFKMDANLSPRQDEFKQAADLVRNKLKEINPDAADLLAKEKTWIELRGAVVDDAVKRSNKAILNLTDAMLGGGGMATGIGLGPEAVFRAFQMPEVITSIANFMYKASEKLSGAPAAALKGIPIIGAKIATPLLEQRPDQQQ
jgi:hypothetical protein